MDNVYVNGNMEIVASDRDIVDIVREHCGDDFADVLEERLSYRELTEEEIEEVLESSDFYVYESSLLDEWNDVGCEVTKLCEVAIGYIEDTKDKLLSINSLVNSIM